MRPSLSCTVLMTTRQLPHTVRYAAAAGALASIAACADGGPVSPSVDAASGPQAVVVGASSGIVPGPSTSISPASYPLYAGGGGSSTGTPVGTVNVYSSAVAATPNPNDYTITVTYNVGAGFCISETHLEIDLSTDGVPQKNGNPAPGQFEYKGSHNCATTVTYSEVVDLGSDDGVVIAAHAVVSGSGTVGGARYVSGGSLPTYVVARRPGNAMSATTGLNSLVVDAWEAFGDPAEPLQSLWDQAIVADGAAGQWLIDNGADWVWESYRSADPVQGTVIQMQASIESPAAQSGVFRITCDNGYRLQLNGANLSGPDGATAGYGTQFSSAFYNALTNDLAAGVNLKQANVSADGWQSVESYNVNLLAGTNTFTIYAANEYQNTDDAHTGYPSGPRARPASTDPTGTVDDNPAGCIFGLQANGTTTSIGRETAWGAPNGFSGATTGANVTGGNFTGKNWATYFVYEVR